MAGGLAEGSDAPHMNRRLAPLLLSALVVCGTCAVGVSDLERIETGRYSEEITFAEAREMAAGNHRFGIVEYTHFPNGPLYVVTALVWAGIDAKTMRLVPVGVAALAMGFFSWVLLSWASRPSLRVWIVLGSAVLILQPAMALWMGALHEHSYALSLALLALATSAWASARNSWLLFPLGFVAGWIGYDWLPGQAVVVLGARWLVFAQDRRVGLLQAGAAACLDTLKFASGASLAVLAHLVQLAGYFESFGMAVRDLLGSAAARASSEGARIIDPDYGRFIEEDLRAVKQAYESQPELAAVLGPDFSYEDPSRSRLAALLAHQFVRPRWSMIGLLGLAAAGGLLMTLRELGMAPTSNAAPPRARVRIAVIAVVATLLAVTSTIVWTFLMPQHAVGHMHMLPRHGLLAVAILLALPVMLLPPASGRPIRVALESRATLKSAALYLVFPLLALAIGLLAVVSPG